MSDLLFNRAILPVLWRTPVRVEVLKRKIRLHLPSATPDQAIFSCALSKLGRLVT
jgi:hypothetical protein